MISLTHNLAGGDTLDSGMVHFLYSEGILTGGFKSTLIDGRVRIMADVSWMD